MIASVIIFCKPSINCPYGSFWTCERWPGAFDGCDMLFIIYDGVRVISCRSLGTRRCIQACLSTYECRMFRRLRSTSQLHYCLLARRILWLSWISFDLRRHWSLRPPWELLSDWMELMRDQTSMITSSCASWYAASGRWSGFVWSDASRFLWFHQAFVKVHQSSYLICSGSHRDSMACDPLRSFSFGPISNTVEVFGERIHLHALPWPLEGACSWCLSEPACAAQWSWLAKASMSLPLMMHLSKSLWVPQQTSSCVPWTLRLACHQPGLWHDWTLDSWTVSRCFAISWWSCRLLCP